MTIDHTASSWCFPNRSHAEVVRSRATPYNDIEIGDGRSAIGEGRRREAFAHDPIADRRFQRLPT
jgi:hypothetical protein